MKAGMKMMMMERMMQRPESNRSEYGGSNRRMIGYDRGEGGNARTANYGESYGGGGSNYAENRMEGGGGSSNYGNRMEYGMEGMENRRRRDSRGRYMESEGYEGNRGYGRNETKSRRRRDSRGRYAMGGMDDDEEEDDKRSQTWYPPYLPPMSMYPGNSYGDVYAHGSIYAPGAMNKPMGGAMMEHDMSAPVDEHTAKKWVQKMDGGEKFKIEQTEQQRMAICPECERWEFYVAMNAMYSDYCETAKKMNIDRPDYYAHMAKDFLKDKDAKPHKLRRYMMHIAA